MEDKFSVKVYLVVIAIEADPANKDQSRLLVVGKGDQTTFPSQYLKRIDTTKDIASRLLKDYTGVTQDWAILFPFGVIDDVDMEKEAISVLYGVFIPGVTRIRTPDTFWQTYSELSTLDSVPALTKKLAYEVIWRQV